MRAVIYARYSSDLQRDASIDDQVRVCRARADKEGWQVVEVFADHAISGATTLRPGYQDMMAALRGGRIDFVLAESLDRFSRDQEHIAGFYKQVIYAGAKIITLAEGDVSELHVGLKGTMGALYLRDLAQKTRRGLEGKVRAGRGVGTTPYCYALVRQVGNSGEFERGLRQIAPTEAAIIRRIFEDYARGQSPLAISKALNAEAVTGPSGTIWYDASIRGRPGRGDGILRNQIYIGRQVWNRRHLVKDPVSGTRHRRANDPGEVVVQDVPELRIVDQQLWDQVQARLGAEQARRPARTANTAGWNFWEHRRPRHLLTGKVVCGVCGALFKTLGQDYLGCRAASQGSCRNTRRVRRGQLDAHVLDGLSRNLMDPDLVREFVTAFTAEWNRLLAEHGGAPETRKAELQATERKINHLVDTISDGMRSPELKTRLAGLEIRKARLIAKQGRATTPLPALHPNITEIYRREIARLRKGLSAEDNVEALEAARQLIDRIIVSPPEEDGNPPQIEIIGEFVAMLQAGGLGTSNSKNRAENTSVLRALASSVKAGQGAQLPGRGFRGTKSPWLFPYCTGERGVEIMRWITICERSSKVGVTGAILVFHQSLS